MSAGRSITVCVFENEPIVVVKDGFHFRETLRAKLDFVFRPSGVPPAISTNSWTYLAETFESAKLKAKEVRKAATKQQGGSCNKVCEVGRGKTKYIKIKKKYWVR